MVWTKKFWQGAAERALKTFLQTGVAVLVAQVGAETIGVTAGLTDVNALSALNVAGLAAFLSLATSVGNADFTAGPDSEW